MGLFRKSGHAYLMASVAVGALALSSSAAWAQTKPITIPPQTLASALHDFGSQTGRQIFFAPELTASKTSPGVAGATDEQLALAQILQGTGLTFRREANAFIIEPSGASDPQSGSAAGDGADQGTVQALIVTAQKREEDIQDVPIAISAFTQEDLTRSQVAGGPDLMTQVPNFTFTKTNFSSYSIQIRGIGTQAISATVDPAVAIAFNNTPFIRNRFFEQEFYDLQRVEVLRGPQGTLYGRNATAGVVNILSAKPTFQYEAKLSGDLANYNSTRLEGMVNIPLVENKAALRIAGAWTKRDGYDKNQITGNQIDGRDLWSTRVSLRIEPTDAIQANLIWEHFQEDDDRLRSGKQLCHKDVPTQIGGVAVDSSYQEQQWLSQGCTAASLYAPESFETPNGFALPYYNALIQPGLPGFFGFDPYLSTTQSRDLRTIESTVDPHYKARSDVAEIQLSFDLGHDLTLASETGYNVDTIFSTQDFNRFNTAPGAFGDFVPERDRRNLIDENGVYCDPQIGCADRVVAVDLSTARSRQFSQEFRLSSDFEGPVNFSLGANFLRYDTMEKYYVFINTVTATAANTWIWVHEPDMPPWQAGVSDNHECLRHGMVEGDPTQIQKISGCMYIDPNPIGSLNDLGHNYFLSKNPYKLISYAAFGEVYDQITPNLKLTAGLRWTVDRKEAPEIPSWLLGANTVGYPVADVVRQEWREPTGRLTLDWKPDLAFTDETLLYGSYAHGYKAGGANPPPTATIVFGDLYGGAAHALDRSLAHPRTFKPEFVDAFEVGTKNTLLDGRMTLNADAFYYDYSNYQISQIVDRAALNYNFDSKVWGLELEADWRPLENLRLAFKGGYERTRVGDGSRAIDFMDRTAGDPNWVVMKSFPTQPSNCIIPTWLATYGGRIHIEPGLGDFPVPGFCVLAYQAGLDPVTEAPYVPNPTTVNAFGGIPLPDEWIGYRGFDPTTAPNGGDGIAKNLAGKELPNAPHFTATVTADYTVPLPNDWLMTLHSDFYYQAEAWTRIFNTPGYDKLKAYTNVNFAAIFTNEDAGWNIMAYVKNAFDRDGITGAFLNSDDTGLTTNVFLTEPRLYGIRVTKQWTGASPWGGQHEPGKPYPFVVELGGQIQRHDAPYSPYSPGFASAFPAELHPGGAQNKDLDWGDGRDVKITYAPDGPWKVSLAARFGKTNGTIKLLEAKKLHGACLVAGTPFESVCETKYDQAVAGDIIKYPYAYSNTTVQNQENHSVIDFAIGRDVGLGALGDHSTVELGVRYAELKSRSSIQIAGVPSWQIPEIPGYETSQHHRYESEVAVDRSFRGAGPILSWDAAKSLIGGSENHLDIDWSMSGGVLFGRQKTHVNGQVDDSFYDVRYFSYLPRLSTGGTTTPVEHTRSSSVKVPTVAAALGLSYSVDRLKVSTGYRWERYFNAIDGGVADHKSYDRTIDGPYFKIAVGFGG